MVFNRIKEKSIYRKFNGKRYSWKFTQIKKRWATKLADEWRKKGFLVRIVKIKGVAFKRQVQYRLYLRRK